jgi:hypothetical protein
MMASPSFDHEQSFAGVLRSLDPSARVLLFVLTERAYPTPILRRVAALATTLDRELCILRVLAPLGSPSSRRSASRLARESDAERVRLARRETAAWCARTLLNPPNGEDIRVRLGDLANEIVAHARDLSAACIFLAPDETGWDGALMALVETCRQPVFVTTDAGGPLATIFALPR